MNMHHVGISVGDLDRSIQFYRTMLGMELVYSAPFGGADYEQVMALENVRGRMCVLCNGSVQLELFEFAHPQPARKDANHAVSDCGITHFGFEVDDIDTM